MGRGHLLGCTILQALDAGSAAALPDGLRQELEQLEDHGGVRHLHDLAAQIKVAQLFFRAVLCCCWHPANVGDRVGVGYLHKLAAEPR